MKKIILFLIALTILFSKQALAVVDLQLLDPEKELIKLITPTPTPTSNLKLFITPKISLRPLATSTPTSTPTITPTSTATPTANPSATIAPTQTPAAITSVVTATPTLKPETTPEVKANNSQMTVWFLLVTIGLLAVIIFVQALPKKDNQDEE